MHDFGLYSAGFFFGIFLMLAVAVMIDYGVRNLIECGRKVRKNSYEDLMQHLFGNKGMDIMLVFLSFIVALIL